MLFYEEIGGGELKNGDKIVSCNSKLLMGKHIPFLKIPKNSKHLALWVFGVKNTLWIKRPGEFRFRSHWFSYCLWRHILTAIFSPPVPSYSDVDSIFVTHTLDWK